MQDRTPSKGHVIALEASSGNEKWKHVRETDGTAENKHSYASPTIYQGAEGEQLIIHGADYVTAHDLGDGHELWRCGNLNPPDNYNPFLRFVASPTWGEGLIVVPTAKRGPVVAIRPGHEGLITDNDQAIAWRNDQGTPDVPSPVIYDGRVYLCGERGTLTCLSAATGEQLYLERTEDDRHRASPVAAGGHLYLTSRRGIVTVVKAGDTFEVAARNDMQESMTASPAVAGGRIYLRTFSALYAIGQPSASGTASSR
jgi:outer membrane protein assembly factor BamB